MTKPDILEYIHEENFETVARLLDKGEPAGKIVQMATVLDDCAEIIVRNLAIEVEDEEDLPIVATAIVNCVSDLYSPFNWFFNHPIKSNTPKEAFVEVLTKLGLGDLAEEAKKVFEED